MPTILNSNGVPFQPSSGQDEIASQITNTGTIETLSDSELLEALTSFKVSDLDLSKLPRSDLLRLQRLLTPKMTRYAPHVPTPKQTAFLLLDCKEAFYGGAAGGGKSDALLMGGLQYVDIKGYAGIIFRKTYADLTKPGALIDRSKEWLSKFDDVKWNDKEKKFEFQKKYGPHTELWSILQFGYMETDNDRLNYQGGEYQFIGFDEVTHISLVCYQYMFSRLRRLRTARIPLRVRSASNPPDDNVGEWVYQRFVDPKTKRKNAVFISAGMDDNPHLDREAYEESLEELDPVTRARLKDGIWTIIRKGNMFKRGWFETVDAPPLYRRRVRFWDMAATDDKQKTNQKKKKTSDPDYTVGFLMSEADGIFYIEDILRVRKRPAETERLQKITAQSDGYNTLIREEQEPGSSGIATIDMKARTTLLGYSYAGIRSTGSKVQRAMSFSSAAERGQIKIVRGCRNIDVFFGEAESFPGAGHDDTVDGASGAFSELGLIPSTVIPMAFDNEEGSYWVDEEASLSGGYFGDPYSYA
jgi:predicted phage terminase large subunit-like protein